METPHLQQLDVARMLTEEPPPIPWLAEPVAVRGYLSMIAGREGQGKSWLTLALALGLSGDVQVGGITCTRGKALYIDAENGPREAHRRIRLAGAQTPDALIYVEASGGFHLQRHFSELRDLAVQHRPDLIVLDSFRSMWPGGDENDSAAVEPVLRNLANLARRLNAAVVLLHHAGKSGPEYRGSTAIGGAVEIGFTLRRHAEDPDARERRELICWKFRPGPEPDPIWLRLAHTDGRFALEETEPYKTGPKTGRPSIRDDLATALLAALATSGPMRRPDLFRSIGRDPKDRTARRALDTLLDTGTILDTLGELKVAEGGATPPAIPGVAGGTPRLRVTPDTRHPAHTPPSEDTPAPCASLGVSGLTHEPENTGVNP